MQKERQYYLNGEKVSFDFFQISTVWLKNSNLNYRLTEEYDFEKNLVSYRLRTDDANLFAFLEQMSDYNERLEQRLNKLT